MIVLAVDEVVDRVADISLTVIVGVWWHEVLRQYI